MGDIDAIEKEVKTASFNLEVIKVGVGVLRH